MSPRAFTIERVEAPGGEVVAAIKGRLTLADAGALREGILAALRGASGPTAIDVSGLESIDAGASAALVDARDRIRGCTGEVEVRGALGDVRQLLELFLGHSVRPCEHPPPGKIGILDQIGRTTLVISAEMRDVFDFVGNVLIATLAGVRSPRTINWAEVGPIAERAGPDGFPIVATLSLLLGLILAFQASIQLRPYGADHLVAAGVALSVVRELGPLMVAITVAGRSGAAFAAELGTMKVSEEVDALRTIGLDPYRYLVLPRLLALVVVVPLLTLFGDAVALFGGFIVGVFGLGLTAETYIRNTHDALTVTTVFTGIWKSIAFGAAIAMIGCERGLATSGGATGVGRSTTSSVVTILFHLVVLDFLFTVFYQVYNI